MDDIKLRAWDVFNGEMFYSKDYDLMSKFWLSVEKRRAGGNTVLIMRYAGRSDKFGKEIYQGDIVKGESYRGIQTGIIGLANTPIPALHFMIYGRDTAPLKVETCKIIGNIHEEPCSSKEI